VVPSPSGEQWIEQTFPGGERKHNPQESSSGEARRYEAKQICLRRWGAKKRTVTTQEIERGGRGKEEDRRLKGKKKEIVERQNYED